ncbi:hypothetical protein BpHYR1_049313 [Brachionus plicatilis]|uniref:Uncharacterized protein n=1 Tax=Brachionus plicatilis TaxID=10195 RepID=A0A3M7PWU2_BRAPC|nr:hypothetical protein BpHYR1_049313 [Brachionus plicatilis]
MTVSLIKNERFKGLSSRCQKRISQTKIKRKFLTIEESMNSAKSLGTYLVINQTNFTLNLKN